MPDKEKELKRMLDELKEGKSEEEVQKEFDQLFKKDIDQSELKFQVLQNSQDQQYTEVQNIFMLN